MCEGGVCVMHVREGRKRCECEGGGGGGVGV